MAVAPRPDSRPPEEHPELTGGRPHIVAPALCAAPSVAPSAHSHGIEQQSGVPMAVTVRWGGPPRDRIAVHDDQVSIHLDTVELLLADQFPHLSPGRVSRLPGTGTVNAIFRIGYDHAARFPLRRDDPARVGELLDEEQGAAAEFADAVAPIAAPRPVAIGEPGRGYPLPWSIQTWVPGATATVNESERVAFDLASAIARIRRHPTKDRKFLGRGRGGHLRSHDDWVEECLDRSSGLIDTDAARRLWGELRDLPRFQPDMMTHGDLIPGNVLTQDGRLVGLLDTGGFGPTDPALDTIAAWHLFDDGPRAAFRDTLACDDLEWQRSRAWAFEQALGAAWYYRDTIRRCSRWA